MSQTDVAIRPHHNVPAPAELQTMLTMADSLVKSGLLPTSIRTAAAALAIMQFGRELGIGPWQAFSGIDVIQGKPTIKPQLMLGLIYQSGHLEEMTVTDTDGTCSVMMQRKGMPGHVERFGMAEAAAMGLASKDNWKKQPAVMRKWRAVAACARVVFPDVLCGMYTPEEMGAEVTVTADGGMEVTAAAVDEVNVGHAPTEPADDSPDERQATIAEIDAINATLDPDTRNGVLEALQKARVKADFARILKRLRALKVERMQPPYAPEPPAGDAPVLSDAQLAEELP